MNRRKDTRLKSENTELSQQVGKEKTKGSPKKRQLIPASNYRQSMRDTFTDKESAGGDLYTMAEICQKFNFEDEIIGRIKQGGTSGAASEGEIERRLEELRKGKKRKPRSLTDGNSRMSTVTP